MGKRVCNTCVFCKECEDRRGVWDTSRYAADVHVWDLPSASPGDSFGTSDPANVTRGHVEINISCACIHLAVIQCNRVFIGILNAIQHANRGDSWAITLWWQSLLFCFSHRTRGRNPGFPGLGRYNWYETLRIFFDDFFQVTFIFLNCL